MAFEDRYNRISYPVNLGQPTIFTLNSGLNVLRGNVIVKGSITIGGGTTNGTPVCEGGPIGLIDRIKIIANKAAGSRYPGGALVNCRPQSLLRFATYEHQGKFVGERSGSNLGNGAAGTYNIYLSIPIYFADSQNKNNVQTALNMNAKDSTGAPIYSAVQVQINFVDTLTAMFAGSDRSITGSALSVQWRDDRIALSTDTIPLVQEDHLAIIQAANTEFVDAAMPNDGAFNQMLIMAQAGSPGWQLSNSLLNKLEMRGGSLNYRENADDIQQQMIDDGLIDPSQDYTGQYYLDWTKGLLANSNPAAGLQHLMDINNPSGAGLDRLLVYTRRVFGLASAS